MNQKDEFKGLNFSQDWYSFYDVIVSSGNYKYLSVEN